VALHHRGHTDFSKAQTATVVGIDFDPVRAIMPDLLTVLELALPILQEAVRTHRLSDDSTERLALDRVESVIAKAHVAIA
jgi:hypothetical protein